MTRIRQQGPSGVTSAPSPRRQERGQRRIEQILDAAGRVFEEMGYGRATTNAIAAEAGISPGSLYQFFTNKEAIVEALEARYAERIQTAHGHATEELADVPLDEAVDRLVDPVVAFALAMPGFHALFAERPMPSHLQTSTHALHAALTARVNAILLGLLEPPEPAERQRIVATAVRICRALVPAIAAASPVARPGLVAELKTVLRAYLGAERRLG